MHHCMLDGGAGVNLMGLLLRASPESDIPASNPYAPRPAPGILNLAAAEIESRVTTPLRVLRGVRRFWQENPDLPDAVARRVGALRDMLGNALPGSRTPINGPLGLQRRVDWMETSLDDMKGLRRRLGCSLNDMALAIVTGALRRYFTRRRLDLEDIDFRVSVPVDVRREDERTKMNNRSSSWIVHLPLDEPDPLKQLATLKRETQRLKGRHQELGVEMMMAAAEEVPALLTLSARAIRGQINLVVTNVPGPPIPLYLLGCRALTMQPFVLLPPYVGLTVALLSYDGKLFWGFMGDAALAPDIADFRNDMEESLRSLEAVAPAKSPEAPARSATDRGFA
jgi:WS/DGAT/MGAT family acyltransferase